MKHVDHTEWELLKRQAASHLTNRFWQSGSFCVVPAEPDRAPEVWSPQVSSPSIHIIR